MTRELAQALAQLQADPDTQSRYDFLASKNSTGTLSPEERHELEACVRANTFLGILKAEAAQFLTPSRQN